MNQLLARRSAPTPAPRAPVSQFLENADIDEALRFAATALRERQLRLIAVA